MPFVIHDSGCSIFKHLNTTVLPKGEVAHRKTLQGCKTNSEFYDLFKRKGKSLRIAQARVNYDQYGFKRIDDVIALLDEKNKMVVYFVSLIPMSFVGQVYNDPDVDESVKKDFNLIYQQLVWRYSEYPQPPRNIVTDIMMNYLLTPGRSLVSDAHHTMAGKRMWERLIHRALSEGKQIYLMKTGARIEQETVRGAIYHLTNTSEQDLLVAFREAWSTTDRSTEQYRWVISEKLL